ncbi:MAG: universal stress protein [Psychroflexus sp.]
MNIVLLSDFSSASTHMLEYAAMLFKNQKVNFTILHIKAPCKGESCSGKCGVVFSQNLKKDQNLLVKKGYHTNQLQTKFIEGAYIESIRSVITEDQIDLIMLGNSNKGAYSTGLFFDKKTLEIITKVKCSVVLVPEEATIDLPRTALLPTDFSITSDYSIFNILTSLPFVNQTHLSLLPTGLNKTLGPNRKHSKELISKVINSLEFKSVKEIYSTNKASCINGFDLVMVLAKNLSIFQDLFSSSIDSLCRPEVPILFLHDSRKL